MNENAPQGTTDVGNVLDKIQKLPSLPSLVIEILESFNDENIDAATLAKKIAHDQAIVARIMRVVNSPFYGLSGQISSISEAIAMLGFNNLRGMVMAAAIINAFPHMEKKYDWKAFWLHNIATAVCAKVLAKHIGLNPETAFTAGLLHDIGKLVIVTYFPQLPVQLPAFDVGSSSESLQAEREALGFDHAALGCEIAKRWNFPLPIQQAIGQHHTDSRADHEKTMSDVVYTANIFALALDYGHLREDLVINLANVAWSRLNLDRDRLDALAQEAQHLYDGAVLLLR